VSARRVPEVVEKPWGREEIFASTERYVGKFLVIRAGEALSLQYHRRKDETLALLEGRVRLLIEERGRRLEHVMHPGDAWHIRPGTRHRLEALSDSRLVEVSTPELDDVVRLEDRYGRADAGRGPEGGGRTP
jgi:mannose-6-phosphate isomerase-like protein (cupin superfamily)